MTRTSILLLFAAFFAPVLLAVALHSEWIDWTPESSRAHGQLVEPVIPLDEEQLKGKWQLVLIEPGACQEACVETMYWLRQIRTAQDRHQGDIGLLLVSGIPLEDIHREALVDLSRDIRIMEGDQAAHLIHEFPEPHPARYILDPDANIIMRYAEDADPNGIRRDLRRLLTWTQRN